MLNAFLSSYELLIDRNSPYRKGLVRQGRRQGKKNTDGKMKDENVEFRQNEEAKHRKSLKK